ncbi:MAG: SDR family NAD(P)-dependent oxidoreductase [Gemmatimonadetes bacterium]|nr:SDR family NAD(P)-dependent oxidoreductase [Gemmatimonadota bacterium]
MPRPLAEQVVVITGASSGIGRCAAQHLAARGARVVVTARRADALDSLVREIEAAGGVALAVPADVTREEELQAVARAALERFGRIDSWVNNASVYIQGRVADITLEEYRRILDVNLLGLISGTKCALEPMLRQGSGVIIQVSSIMGRRGAPWASAYSAAKAGIDGFCEALRVELWGKEIHVATFYPPTVDTPIYHNARGKFGTVPKPPPPVEDPAAAARIIAELAVNPRPVRTFGAFGYLYLGITALLPTRLTDAFLHHASGFMLSDIPDTGDNLDRPLDEVPSIRAGWAQVGWKGFTLGEIMRVLPLETAAGAAALGFAAGRVARRLRGAG